MNPEPASARTEHRHGKVVLIVAAIAVSMFVAVIALTFAIHTLETRPAADIPAAAVPTAGPVPAAGNPPATNDNSTDNNSSDTTDATH